MTGGEQLLQVRGLEVAYGHVHAVKGIDFDVQPGEICTLVGANGAGKSSTLLALSGMVRIRAGEVRFEGEALESLKPHQIVERGLVQVPEGRAILTTLSVRENLELGAYRRKDRHGVASDMERVVTLFPRLKERLSSAAGNLSGGEQQMLAIGRALLARPKLLLLDEPSMGLAPLIVRGIFETLRELNRSGLTILLVEQNVRQALRVARHAHVLENGRIVLHGKSEALMHDPKVQSAYLGG